MTDEPEIEPAGKRCLSDSAFAVTLRTDHAWPTSVTSVSPTTTRSDGRTPTLPAACVHQVIIRPQDSRLPSWETTGSRPAALSTKSAALVIARSSASAQSAAGATGPSEMKNSRHKPSSRTTPLPHAGWSGRDMRRATTGTPSDTRPNAT